MLNTDELKKIDAMTEQEMQEFIMHSDYMPMLKLWRFLPAGHKFFQGKLGAAFTEAITRKRNDIGALNAAEISKKVGWE